MHERVTGKRRDPLLKDPLRSRDPVAVARDIANLERLTRPSNRSNLANTNRESAKAPIQPVPRFACGINRVTGAGDQMEATIP